MCGRVIQSSGPLRYAIVDDVNVRDSRVHNYPPRWNAAPAKNYSSSVAIIRLARCRWTGLIPYWCKDPAGGANRSMLSTRPVRDLPTFRDAYRIR